MPYQDFRQFLDVLRQHGELVDSFPALPAYRCAHRPAFPSMS